ncbi:TetR/AcrR family transcriptional regulator [Mycolicibacterium helvum]|uniref:TetR/AcrR family transcriptional regulator n=1 Tax=Mycolicibacterium helvum TaxID=1534349 RepID=UPI0013D75474|nr:TetR family transcriptional regulator C-terminal domain-containing protein [Mycolicibacterium helvum]
MPKRIDHRARERDVAEAAWKVVARDGVGQLSVRKVAEEAKLATGSLRRAFPTQDALRAYCLELVRERAQARVDTVDQSLPVSEFVEECLQQLLPLDDDRRLEMEVFIAIGVLALTDNALRGPYGKVHDMLAVGCSSLLRMVAHDSAPGDICDDEINTESKRLHALVDGLALHLVRQQRTEPTSWATDVLSTHLRQVRSRWQASSTR